MDNLDIERFFEESKLGDVVERQDRPPNVMWTFRAGSIPMMIQTQENVNRMRIVAFIAEVDDLQQDHLAVLLEANYHSALDARYAMTEEYIVSAFLHPFRELTLTQFVMGLFQTISCAETFGTTFSGGTMIFGSPPHVGGDVVGASESAVSQVMDAVVEKIRQGE